MAAMGFWHLLGKPAGKKALLKKPETIQMKLPPSGSDGSLTSEVETLKTPAPLILGKDGITLHFIPGGELKAESIDSKNAEQIIRISPFYMDEKW